MSHRKPASKTAILRAYARHWGQWQETPLTDAIRAEHPHLRHCMKIWANQRYECQLFPVQSSIGGIVQVGIIRHRDLAAIEWEELQRIVHELFGPEVTAVEVYPPYEYEVAMKSRLRVLWVLPTNWPLPFGLHLPTAWGKPQIEADNGK